MYLNYYLFRSRKLHLFFLSLLYMVQTVITYLVMLSAMSFNVWILVAVVLGATFGSWIFGSLRGPYPNASETSKSNSIEVTQQNLLRYYGATTDAAEDEVLGGVSAIRGGEGDPEWRLLPETRPINTAGAAEAVVEVDVHTEH
jgi:hypothetical protein